MKQAVLIAHAQRAIALFNKMASVTSPSSIAAALQQKTELEELKKDTEVTKSVLQGAKNLQDLNRSDNA